MRLGITGGIGAGKSYVSHLLTGAFGIPVYDCDSAAKRLMATSDVLRARLTALIGNNAYLPDGTLNRPVVANYLFADESHASCINAIVHPVVKDDFLRWAAAQEQDGQKIVALESAVLFEAHLADDLDAVIFVDAPVELRLERAMRRDGAAREQILARINRQKADEDFNQACDYVVINDGRDLRPQLQTIFDALSLDCFKSLNS